MKTARFKYLIGAAIVMMLLAGSAWADGKRGRDHNRGGQSYHQGYQKHHGRHFNRPAPHRRPGYFGPRYHQGPKYHNGPRYHQGPRRHHEYAPPYPGHRHPRHHVYRSQAPHTGYGLHFSVNDPYFAFGFSTGGRW